MRLQEVLMVGVVVPTSPAAYGSPCCGAEDSFPPAGLQWGLCCVLFRFSKVKHPIHHIRRSPPAGGSSRVAAASL